MAKRTGSAKSSTDETSDEGQATEISAEVSGEDQSPEAGPAEAEPARAAAPEPDTRRPDPMPQIRQQPRRRGFLAPFLTGAGAVALGFAGAVYVLPRIPPGWIPDSWLPSTRSETELIAGQAARIDVLEKSLAELAGRPSDGVDAATLDSRLAGLRDELAAAAPDLSSLAARLDDLDGRLTALEKRPVAGGAVPSSAIEAIDLEIADLRAEIAARAGSAAPGGDQIAAATAEAESRLAAVSESADKLRAEVDETSRQMRARAAISVIRAALESGDSYDSALADLTAAGVAVPQGLAGGSTGVPTLASLRADFPAAARAALIASTRTGSGDGFLARVGSFLRSQTGARSIAPREGDDPDAILSRAEAALASGDVAGALAGVRSLPPEGQAAFADWIARADARLAALDGMSGAAAALN